MIPFPKMHIAQSVLNRIMNAVHDPLMSPPVIPQEPPTIPDPAVQGATIDTAIETPLPAAGAATPEEEAGAVEASAQGESPLAGMLSAGTF